MKFLLTVLFVIIAANAARSQRRGGIPIDRPSTLPQSSTRKGSRPAGNRWRPPPPPRKSNPSRSFFDDNFFRRRKEPFIPLELHPPILERPKPEKSARSRPRSRPADKPKPWRKNTTPPEGTVPTTTEYYSTTVPTTFDPTTAAPTTRAPTTAAPTTQAPVQLKITPATKPQQSQHTKPMDNMATAAQPVTKSLSSLNKASQDTTGGRQIYAQTVSFGSNNAIPRPPPYTKPVPYVANDVPPKQGTAYVMPSRQPQYAVPSNQANNMAPHSQPNYAVPQVQANNMAPQSQPNYAVTQNQANNMAPQILPNYAVPQNQANNMAPQSQPNYAVPQNQASNMAPQSQPNYAVPQNQANNMAPQSQPNYAAPQNQANNMAPQSQPNYAAHQNQANNMAPQIQPNYAVMPNQANNMAPQSQPNYAIPPNPANNLAPQSQPNYTVPTYQATNIAPQSQPNYAIPPNPANNMAPQSQPNYAVPQNQANNMAPQSQPNYVVPQNQANNIAPASLNIYAPPSNQVNTMAPAGQTMYASPTNQANSMAPQSKPKYAVPQNQANNMAPQTQLNNAVSPNQAHNMGPQSQPDYSVTQNKAVLPNQANNMVPQGQPKYVVPQNNALQKQSNYAVPPIEPNNKAPLRSSFEQANNAVPQSNNVARQLDNISPGQMNNVGPTEQANNVVSSQRTSNVVQLQPVPSGQPSNVNNVAPSGRIMSFPRPDPKVKEASPMLRRPSPFIRNKRPMDLPRGKPVFTMPKGPSFRRASDIPTGIKPQVISQLPKDSIVGMSLSSGPGKSLTGNQMNTRTAANQPKPAITGITDGRQPIAGLPMTNAATAALSKSLDAPSDVAYSMSQNSGSNWKLMGPTSGMGPNRVSGNNVNVGGSVGLSAAGTPVAGSQVFPLGTPESMGTVNVPSNRANQMPSIKTGRVKQPVIMQTFSKAVYSPNNSPPSDNNGGSSMTGKQLSGAQRPIASINTGSAQNMNIPLPTDDIGQWKPSLAQQTGNSVNKPGPSPRGPGVYRPTQVMNAGAPINSNKPLSSGIQSEGVMAALQQLPTNIQPVSKQPYVPGPNSNVNKPALAQIPQGSNIPHVNTQTSVNLNANNQAYVPGPTSNVNKPALSQIPQGRNISSQNVNTQTSVYQNINKQPYAPGPSSNVNKQAVSQIPQGSDIPNVNTQTSVYQNANKQPHVPGTNSNAITSGVSQFQKESNVPNINVNTQKSVHAEKAPQAQFSPSGAVPVKADPLSQPSAQIKNVATASNEMTLASNSLLKPSTTLHASGQQTLPENNVAQSQGANIPKQRNTDAKSQKGLSSNQSQVNNAAGEKQPTPGSNQNSEQTISQDVDNMMIQAFNEFLEKYGAKASNSISGGIQNQGSPKTNAVQPNAPKGVPPAGVTNTKTLNAKGEQGNIRESIPESVSGQANLAKGQPSTSISGAKGHLSGGFRKPNPNSRIGRLGQGSDPGTMPNSQAGASTTVYDNTPNKQGPNVVKTNVVLGPTPPSFRGNTVVSGPPPPSFRGNTVVSGPPPPSFRGNNMVSGPPPPSFRGNKVVSGPPPPSFRGNKVVSGPPPPSFRGNKVVSGPPPPSFRRNKANASDPPGFNVPAGAHPPVLTRPDSGKPSKRSQEPAGAQPTVLTVPDAGVAAQGSANNNVAQETNVAAGGNPGNGANGPCNMTPVCGSDGFTYMSSCFLWEGLTVACEGYCPCPGPMQAAASGQATRHSVVQDPVPTRAQPQPWCDCHPVYQPVCSTTGATYENDCAMRCREEEKACNGACPCSSAHTTTAQPCENFCPATFTPVCSVLEHTFDNDCLRQCSGEVLACTGECPCLQTVIRDHRQTLGSHPAPMYDSANVNNEPSNQPLSTSGSESPAPPHAPANSVPTNMPILVFSWG